VFENSHDITGDYLGVYHECSLQFKVGNVFIIVSFTCLNISNEQLEL